LAESGKASLDRLTSQEYIILASWGWNATLANADHLTKWQNENASQHFAARRGQSVA
jgi:hypothetical protein